MVSIEEGSKDYKRRTLCFQLRKGNQDSDKFSHVHMVIENYH